MPAFAPVRPSPALRARAEWLGALADPTRLALLRVLATGGTQNVTQLAKATGCTVVNVSHHLGVMRAAGLVRDEKQGRFVLYTIRGAALVSASGAKFLELMQDSGAVVRVPLN